jgi:citrate lyase subunit beta/citryl-CoA lyase
MAVRSRRSALYMPGANARALDKARTIGADALILDLEDAVAPEAKAMARAQVSAAVSAGGYGRREVVIRVNGIGSPWFADDIAAAVAAAPDAILVPKVSHAEDLVAIGKAVVAAPQRTRVWAMIETPLAILRIGEIASAATDPDTRLAVFVVGTNDLVKETRADISTDRGPALYWLSATVTAARAYGLDVLDGVFNDFRNLDGLRRECIEGRRLGMDGKTLIHPDQVAVANEVFAPTAAEIAAARRIVAAFALPENRGSGVITIDGRMVELLHRDMAQRTLTLADAIAAVAG